VNASRLAVASAVGTTLEWYDFTIYNTLAALIFNELFFPSFDPMMGTILAFRRTPSATSRGPWAASSSAIWATSAGGDSCSS
jgi:hypothetical protein